MAYLMSIFAGINAAAKESYGQRKAETIRLD
jgi:hypothetical protein